MACSAARRFGGDVHDHRKGVIQGGGGNKHFAAGIITAVKGERVAGRSNAGSSSFRHGDGALAAAPQEGVDRMKEGGVSPVR